MWLAGVVFTNQNAFPANPNKNRVKRSADWKGKSYSFKELFSDVTDKMRELKKEEEYDNMVLINIVESLRGGILRKV